MKYLQIVGGQVVAAFICQQREEAWPGIIEVADDDPRYLDYIGRSAQGAVVNERAWRDAELARLVWIRDRHRDQLEIGADTTLTVEQFGDLLVFMQALRDWPQSESFPDVSARPVEPAFLEQMRGDQ